MANAHFPLLIVLAMASGLAGVILGLSYILGPKRPTVGKSEPFECGNVAPTNAAARIHVQFYLVALLFLAFDVEAVFIYPWAVLFGEAVRTQAATLVPLAIEMATFAAIVLSGLLYVWKKDALAWQRGRG